MLPSRFAKAKVAVPPPPISKALAPTNAWPVGPLGGPLGLGIVTVSGTFAPVPV
jgi:hypothetical protein